MGSAKTVFSFSTGTPASLVCDGLVIPVYQNKKVLVWTDALKSLDKAMQGMIKATVDEEKFDGGKGKLLSFRKTPGDKISAKRVLLLGLGEKDKLTSDKLEANLQKAVATLTGWKGLKSVAIVLPDTGPVSVEIALQALADAVYQATYRSAESKDPPPDVKKVLILGCAANATQKTALFEGEVLARARSFAKDLVNKPSNTKTTNTLAEAARKLAKKPGFTVTVQSSVSWIEKNMPCFFEVAKGALKSDPPKFITIAYKPSGAGKRKKLAIVGKSVIFDTGGYQVKPGNSMVTMKGDMTGGAMVVATMHALAELRPKNIEVTAYLAAAPNKIDGGAMIPDSIVNTTCGKKVEIRHTDAEGRLTLIDAVAQACKAKPDEVVTIATLTGAAMRAVGLCVALMGNNDDLRERIYTAAKSFGEPFQTLEVFESDYDDIKSKLDGADIINTSKNASRGAQSAACFVMSGATEGTPMAHLDIAGADMTPDEKATGIGQKTLIRYVLNENRSSGSAKPRSGKKRS